MAVCGHMEGTGISSEAKSGKTNVLQYPVKTVLACQDLSNWVSGSKLWWVWVDG
jgi:hypothetical protein